MNGKVTASLVLILILLASASHAAVIERDLVPGSGDGLLTFDTVNQREWLDLSETLLIQYPGASLEERYQSVVVELDDGGMFAGFTVAKSDDVFALAESAGIDTGTLDFAVNEQATARLIGLLSATVKTSTASATWGFLDETVSALPERRIVANLALVQSPDDAAGLGTFHSFGNLDNPANFTGVMLYRNIPEPESCLLIVQSAIAFIGIRRLLVTLR